MSRFIETIQLRNGNLLNLEFHQKRFELTRLENLGLKNHPLLEDTICVPQGLDHGFFKCRVTYQRDIELIEFSPYHEREVHSLKLVYSDSIDYGFKYADRTELKKLYEQRGIHDDILVVKNGCVSDSFYANVVFWDGLVWVTPDTPLLPGTMRASLLAVGEIVESRIHVDDLGKFQKLKLINAMNDLRKAPEIPMESIH